jgi:hypothetical protein
MGMKQSVCNPKYKTEPYNNVTMNPMNILFEISILKTTISKSTPPKTFHTVKKNPEKQHVYVVSSNSAYYTSKQGARVGHYENCISPLLWPRTPC